MKSCFEPELSLAVASCRWPSLRDRDEHIRSLAREVRDWKRFELIVQRNRVAALAHHTLVQSGVELPPSLEHRLSRRALAAAHRSLAMARESVLLQQVFEREGLPVMIVKGTPLALLAYGQIGLKESWDIDLLTSPKNIAEAVRLLVERGYRNSLGHLDSRQFEAFLRVRKEASFDHPVTGITVELHWRLLDDRYLLNGVDAEGPAQLVATPAGSIRTIADDALFAYLCLHGAVHNWGRLKWLADLGALLSLRDEAEVQRLFQAAHGYGAGRAASVALMLCSRLLSHKLDEAFLRSLSATRIHQYLERNVLACLAYGSGAVEHQAYTATWLRVSAAQLIVAPGPIHALERARFIWNSSIDRIATPLPNRLDFLYHVLRIPLWLGRIGKRLVKRRTAKSSDLVIPS